MGVHDPWRVEEVTKRQRQTGSAAEKEEKSGRTAKRGNGGGRYKGGNLTERTEKRVGNAR